MKKNKVSYINFFKQQLTEQNSSDFLLQILKNISEAGKRISRLLAYDNLSKNFNKVNTSINVQNEKQKPLDVLSNNIFLDIFKKSQTVAALASEELEEAVSIPESKSPYILLFDPLDGSSNLEINGSIGTIFSILQLPDGRTTFEREKDLLQPGNKQVGAGYLFYGPTTLLVVSMGRGVDCFILNPENNEFILRDSQLKVSLETQEFAINVSNQRFWEFPIKKFIEDCLAGKKGSLGKDYNMRWVAAFVGDIHRILKRGGIFMYPKDSKNPLSHGRLRLLYELNPMAYIITQAGGIATSGRERILDIVPTSLHQRVGIMIGSKLEIERIERYYQEYSESSLDSENEIPFFGNRSLFINN